MRTSSLQVVARTGLVPALLLLALAARTPGQGLLPEPAPTAWDHVDLALRYLDQGLLQQLDPARWPEVRPTAGAARQSAAAAREAGAPSDLCRAIHGTAKALAARQAALDDQELALMSAAEAWPDDPDRRIQAMNAAEEGFRPRFAAIADDLMFLEGRLPQSTFLLVEVLFGLERDDEGEAALRRGLALWPTDWRLHDLARAWADVLPRPEDLIVQLGDRVDQFGESDSDFGALALETIAVLHDTMGRAQYDGGNWAVAALHFDRQAKALHRARSMPCKWSSDRIEVERADALVNMAFAYQGEAARLWELDRADEDAMTLARGSEDALADALREVPNHEAATNAVFWLGDLLMKKGGGEADATATDLAHMRDYYGRMARRFDNADWWNNYAFWCRETGTAAELAGDEERAESLYTKAYEAYRKAITLDPDNARYVNDTGLMLYYHLGRDLEEAERLFLRAWELGRDVCDNPFADQASFDENFSAYTDAMLNLARLYADRGDLDRAREVIDELVELAPERPDVQLTRRRIARDLDGGEGSDTPPGGEPASNGAESAEEG